MASIGPDSWGTASESGTGRVILGEVLWGHIRATEAHHRDFPEVRAEGGSLEEAIRNLMLRLSRLLDTAITSLDRERLEQAVADIRGSITVAQGHDGV
jgi:hypothetical protein